MMLLDPVFSVKNDQGYYDVRPDFAAVSEEGLIFLSHSRVTDVYTPEGELVLSLPQQWSSMEWKGTGLLKGNRYITNGEAPISATIFPACRRPPKRRYHFSHQILTWGPMASDGSGEYTLPIPGESTI